VNQLRHTEEKIRGSVQTFNGIQRELSGLIPRLVGTAPQPPLKRSRKISRESFNNSLREEGNSSTNPHRVPLDDSLGCPMGAQNRSSGSSSGSSSDQLRGPAMNFTASGRRSFQRRERRNPAGTSSSADQAQPADPVDRPVTEYSYSGNFNRARELFANSFFREAALTFTHINKWNKAITFVCAFAGAGKTQAIAGRLADFPSAIPVIVKKKNHN